MIRGWRGVCLIAITYVYFLIFAQFAFLNRLAALQITSDHLKIVMGAMALGGILLSLLAPRVTVLPGPAWRLRAAFTACGAAAVLSTLSLGLTGSVSVSFLIGSGLGLLTVTLVTHLRIWIGSVRPLWNVGLGTGIGYFVCNIPSLFTAAPEIQALVAAVLCLAGVAIAFGGNGGKQVSAGSKARAGSKSAQTKASAAHVWQTLSSALPVLSRLFAGRRPIETGESAGGTSFLRVLACFTALVWLDSAAFFIIQNTPSLKAGTWQGTLHLEINGLIHLGAALLAVRMLRRRGLSFVLSAAFLALGAAGMVILLPSLVGLLRRKTREAASVAAVLVAAYGIDQAIHLFAAPVAPSTAVARGRRVYIDEGCIGCHSQYVRPETADVSMWGPAQSLEQLRAQQPPLIGNRRQGPDLAEVGNRRSRLWLKAHLYDPAELSPASFMPSYRHLFRDGRGDDLVAYLVTRRSKENRVAWSDSEPGDAGEGRRLFDLNCATCHNDAGGTRNRWRAAFAKLPPRLDQVRDRHSEGELARIVKFGIPGADMPGHEYFSDGDIASIARFLAGR
jgi:cytochrome c oxidase cbb3-type subunit 2